MTSILLAESDSTLRVMVSELLTFSSYQVTMVANGRAAFEMLQSDPDLPDLILSDLLMEPMNGIDLLDAIRNAPRYRDLPFLVMASPDQIAALRLELTHAVDGYIAKPFTIKELLASIQRALAKPLSTRSAQQQESQDDARPRLA